MAGVMLEKPRILNGTWRPSLQRVTFITEHPEVEVDDSSTWAQNISIHGTPVPKWSTRVARARVEWFLETQDGEGNEPFLLVGRKVCKAFRLDADAPWFEWYGVQSHRHPMIPFSLSNGHKAEANALVEALVTGELPDYGYKKKEETA